MKKVEALNSIDESEIGGREVFKMILRMPSFSGELFPPCKSVLFGVMVVIREWFVDDSGWDAGIGNIKLFSTCLWKLLVNRCLLLEGLWRRFQLSAWSL